MRGTVTTPVGRVAALGRAELTLFVRSKAMIVAAVFVPLVLPFSVRSVVEDMDLKESGLSVGLVLLPGAIGFSLLFAVYSALVNILVGRREELVLKRLRTGEVRDVEILTGAALPAVTVGLVQSLVLAVGCTALLDLPAPKAPHLAVVGLLLGLVLCAALAAVTSGFTRTVESAQVTALPLVMVSMIGSGITVPLEVLPDRVASVFELFPLSPVITLVRGGWTGNLSLYEAIGPVMTALAWTALGVFAVQRWFRWEPRR
ncbi:ABC transporter permease [Streptomyces sp. ISL-22]|uniref:ABC transporter permease n=1 Tax=unclassified Streptomyces TaxID=2593676 RepID=UPI001BE7B96F|nr:MULTISPECIES: ABC transporter permease [unclassified Streptomyces]MBT2422276.1 ABC transporter permease [Streptomyces sp. ISL-24]MBT2435841.1 ABC transporter permease [Streptomyces sp. ISL-22]